MEKKAESSSEFLEHACHPRHHKFMICAVKLCSLGDEQMLEAVEATFKQFSAFLDLLHDKG